MLLDLASLSINELNEKITTLTTRMRHLEMAGSHGSNAYQQCIYWMQQINYELEERAFMEEIEGDPAWTPGVVATIGEDHLRSEDDGVEEK